LQDTDRGLGAFIVVDLGVCDAGVIVDDGVDKRAACGQVPGDPAASGPLRGD
jgi:hypothetical protein